MITGLHSMFYAPNADAARAFLRDVLKFPFVDAGHGWLIFAAPPAEMGVHPAEGAEKHQEFYFMCDDVNKTVAELKARGVEFTKPVSDQGYGLVTAFNVPGFGEIGLYEPRHPIAAGMSPGKGSPAKKPKAKKAAAHKKKPATRKRVSRSR